MPPPELKEAEAANGKVCHSRTAASFLFGPALAHLPELAARQPAFFSAAAQLAAWNGLGVGTGELELAAPGMGMSAGMGTGMVGTGTGRGW